MRVFGFLGVVVVIFVAVALKDAEPGAAPDHGGN
jgi:hypothetical protein